MVYPAWEWKSEIPSNVCDIIIENFNSDYKEGKVGEQETYNKDIRNVEVSFRKTSWINALIGGYIRYANFVNFHYDLSDEDKEVLQFSKYTEGCFYKQHTDYGDNDAHITRKLSLSLELSDENEYEDGELLLYNNVNNSTITACKSKGSIIVFDSRMTHEVTPVTSGTRYSLVKWYHGDQPLK